MPATGASTLFPEPIWRRLVVLAVGLVLFGVSLAMVLNAGLGLAPWDVFHQGIAETTGIRLGAVLVGVSFLVLAFWLVLPERPGIGTICNAIIVGVVFEATIGVLPVPDGLVAKLILLAAGVLLNGLATGLYVGAGLGPGPRDGLMTGISRKTGFPIGAVRTGIEAVVLASGWLLGGTVGVGTVVFALGIGPLVQLFLPPCQRLVEG